MRIRRHSYFCNYKDICKEDLEKASRPSTVKGHSGLCGQQQRAVRDGSVSKKHHSASLGKY